MPMSSARFRPLTLLSLCGLAALSLASPAVVSAAAGPADPSSASGGTAVTPTLSHGQLELASTGALTSRHQAPVWNHGPVGPGARASWKALEKRLGVTGSLWNPLTQAPLRIWGAGAPAPGTQASPSRARRFALDLLGEHIDVLAPGAAVSDFAVVSEVLSGGVRSVGLVQRYRGRDVVGGQLSFRFKGDRLVMIASEAVAVGELDLSGQPISSERARAKAGEWFVRGGYVGVETGAVEGPMILPMIDRGGQRFAEVMRVEVAASAPLARAWVYVDAREGTPIAARSHLYAGTSTIHADIPLRRPGAERDLGPLIDVEVTVEGEVKITDDEGSIISPDVPTEIIPGLTGALVKVSNANGEDATEVMTLGPGEVGVWSYPDDPEVEGQLTNYVTVYRVKQRLLELDSELEWLKGQISVTSNVNGTCNAYSDGDSIFFLRGSEGQCEYTARLPDVSYHEFGHSIHTQSLIPGVGTFEGALSEGISDYLAATTTGDPKMGVGFFLDEQPMRDLDPEGYEWHWPEDRGFVHDEGRIIGGTLWDLRVALVDKLGEEEGINKADEIWYESIRRASDIPTMYPEALLTDDDDGDLSNGTPNQCEIDVAFYKHGLVLADAFGASVETLAQEPGGEVPVELTLDVDVKEACLGISFKEASLEWRVRGSKDSQIVAMSSTESGFVGSLPPQEDGVVVEYRVHSEAEGGLVLGFPDNEADPWYERYYGPVTEIYCADFEGDPEAEGWLPFVEWAFGEPQGVGGDPEAAYEGSQIAGVDLGVGSDGRYDESRVSRLKSPTIDVSGHDIVRLQFWRWLQVEDHEYDQALIEVNGNLAWRNATRGLSPELNDLNHLDREWVFRDIDITPGVVDGSVELDFLVSSDGFLHFAGWNIDKVCLVGVEGPPAPVCGDGVVDAGEACDDGNLDAGDGCDATCAIEPVEETTTAGETTGGDDTTSDGSATTGGPMIDDDDGGCGCTSSSEPSGGWSALALFGLLALRRRRD